MWTEPCYANARAQPPAGLLFVMSRSAYAHSESQQGIGRERTVSGIIDGDGL